MSCAEPIAEEGHQFKKLLNKISGQPASYLRKSLYTFGKTLGAGTFGIVRYARNNQTQEEVAVKIILKKALKGNEEMVIDEIRMLLHLHHPHIVGFRDWFESKDKFYIVTQLATGGELFDRIIKLGRFTERDAADVVQQMLEAVEYLHSKDIVHRDLKPENVIYLTPKPDSEVVLADFGIAKKLAGPSEKLTSSAGSFGYAAPEVVMATGHGKPCDIWSLGVITYTLLCGYLPFRSENVPDFIKEVRSDNAVLFHADYWSDVSKDARRFIIKALQLDPEKRPTASDLLNDQWLVSVAAEHHKTDLLPNLKQSFDAKAKFRQAIEVVLLHNRINKLKKLQTEDDDDPDEIALFKLNDGELPQGDGTLLGWGKLANALQDNGSSSSSVKEEPKRDPAHTRTKSEIASAAFAKLVEVALENRDRVESFKDENESPSK